MAIIYCCMSLRRFPWKVPRLTDTSYKYFVAEPTPGTPNVEDLRRGSKKGASAATSIAGDSANASRNASVDAANHNSSSTSQRPSQGELAKADSRPETPDHQEQKQPQTIKGPWRLLRLLPRVSRFIIGRMLDVDPKSRATLEEVMSDSWVTSQPVCRQEVGGSVIRAEGHTHVLEISAGSSAPPAKK